MFRLRHCRQPGNHNTYTMNMLPPSPCHKEIAALSAGRHPRLGAALELLARLVAVPSPSRDEQKAADIWQQWLTASGVADTRRLYNNVWAISPFFSPRRPTLMMNSHLDTVKPAASYTRDPYLPQIEEGRLYGLGSNDAGASAVAMAACFLELRMQKDLPVNLIFAVTAEEEVMGEHGMRAFLPHLASLHLTPDMVLVGEPTGMHAAVAERGLVVLDAVAEGRSGHAARDEGINAIYRALEDIERLREYRAPRVSALLGDLKVNVTMINAGSQHNVVPDRCGYVVDVRTTDAYSNAETVELLQRCVKWSRLKPRSTRVQASVIPLSHPLVKSAMRAGRETFVSPTTSDMALMHGIDSLKMGPGDSARSHAADEYIEIDEIEQALTLYPEIIRNIYKQ